MPMLGDECVQIHAPSLAVPVTAGRPVAREHVATRVQEVRPAERRRGARRGAPRQRRGATVVFTVQVTMTAFSTGPERLVSGEAVEFDIRIARLGSRALALLLDILIEVAAFVVLLLVTLLGTVLLRIMTDALMSTVVTVLMIAVLVGYPTVCETTGGGRTLGKRAMGLRVVRDDGGPIRFRHALTRSLVALAVEWPGLLLPPITWVVSLVVMLANPRGKRLGDFAAGTIVIHERTPAAWGWVPAMPPALASWATTLDLTGLGDDLALTVRHYLSRNREICEPFRSRLGYSLAVEVAQCTTPPAPPGTPGWAYLAAVLAERHRRSLARLAAARSATAAVWPELAAATQPGVPPLFIPPPSWPAGPGHTPLTAGPGHPSTPPPASHVTAPRPAVPVHPAAPRSDALS